MRFKISKKERRRRKLAKRQLNAFYAFINKIALVVKKVASATLILIDKTRKVAESVAIARAAVDEQYTENAEHCVVCGDVIPEGRQVCYICEKRGGGS